ncbi:MAG: DUF3078 domain-containing protein [Prolixibacteraceae bacterium]
MRILFFSLFIFLQIQLFASTGAKRAVSDTIQIQLDDVKSILFSGEWEAVDNLQFQKIKELIDYIENSPIDSIVLDLKADLDNSRQLIKRELRNIPQIAQIDGYIRASEINNSLLNIEKRTSETMPLNSIIVPEDQFVGMYSKLPLVSFENSMNLINDSLVVLPDSILVLMANSKLTHAAGRQVYSDSTLMAYLERERRAYNQKIIETYRDSISTQFRYDYLNRYIETQKKKYTDSVTAHNMALLNSYNDSISSVVNKKFSNNLNSLLTYVYRMPNELEIYNYYNDKTSLSLQNDAIWYEWIWLKNAQNDSLGLRIENLNRNQFRILIDETVSWSRLRQQGSLEVNKIKQLASLDQKLLKVYNRKPVLSPWKLEGKIYSGFTQTYINDYWSKGGNSSASVLSTFTYSANYSKGKVKFENGADAKLGLIYYLPDEGTVAYRNWHKNSDNFELNSRLGYSAFKEWYYSAEANFKTQFFLGYKNNKDSIPNSAIFSPAYLTFSGGFDYKPSKEFSAFLSPLSVKLTYVSNPRVNETSFGLLEGQTRKTRIGMSGKFELSKKVMDNISLKTKNSIFISYGNDAAGESQFTKLPDFDSETTIDFKINQFITTQINLHFIYDKDVKSKWTDSAGVEQIGNKLQVKEFITFGISYKI